MMMKTCIYSNLCKNDDNDDDTLYMIFLQVVLLGGHRFHSITQPNMVRFCSNLNTRLLISHLILHELCLFFTIFFT